MTATAGPSDNQMVQPTHFGNDGNLPMMQYSCQTCAKRKIKCDKASPRCSGCVKGDHQCIYQAPPPRRRKRKLSSEAEGSSRLDDVNQKLAQYEGILRANGLLPPDASKTLSSTGPGSDIIDPMLPSDAFLEPEVSKNGKLVSGEGKSRYINSGLWRSVDDDDMPNLSEEEDEAPDGVKVDLIDPLTGAFLCHHQSLLDYHPTHSHAMMLWEAHIDMVEPLCKILHIPTTRKMIEMVTQQPAIASKSEECLLFAIYHFAVYAMTEEECLMRLAQGKAALLQAYHYAARQALVNASFLKTTELSIIQALILFLLSCRYTYDPHVFWILTGVTVRIAQRMGLQRDGQALGLAPFDTQMRRRVFYQVIPLDGMSSRMTGTGIGITQGSWDTKPPLNLNDDDIWPGMTKMPEEKKGATDMMFCLSRATVGKYFIRAGMGSPSQHLKDRSEVEAVISETEDEVENGYIRYCDIVNPLHFLTMVSTRSAITNMRMRIILPKYQWKIATNPEKREFFFLAQRILDTDIAACSHSSLRKFQWHVSVFFVWGSWDSMIFTLTTLRRPDMLSALEIDAAWSRMEQIYTNHSKELLISMQALQVAIGRIALKAWEVRARSNVPEPAFITTLRSLRKVNPRAKAEEINSSTMEAMTEGLSSISPNDASGAFSSGSSTDFNQESGLDETDWMFWDQLIQDFQAKGG
ncbi:hypothetical protein LTR97_005158 [Elasticomyces elasticus]|uniref:Zn(2)-C6 fungal-type domain-containing protein n=1 Tax=Elasticomyces elasticus TaxID=574655 RepID=A0AAN7VT25_9PEZI|nr:hypothetical protein LTR97_005158 [Elasticomyces elasticus]